MRGLRLFSAALWFVTALQADLWGVSADAALFSQGQTRLSLGVGYGSLNHQDYGVVGLGAGYCLWEGLEAGLAGEAWLGSKPHLYSVSPELRYVWTTIESFKPYLGGFYKHSFFDTWPDLDSAGGRAGIVTPLGSHSYLSAGLVYESYFSCRSTLYGSCSQVYPELGFALTY